MEGISFIYPAWLILLCLAGGFLYGILHYWGSTQFKDQGNWLRRLLFAVRTLSITLIALLLLGPLMKYFINVEDPPVLVVAADATSSVILASDSTEMASIYQQLEQLETVNPGRVQTDFLLFGESTRTGKPSETDFADRSTNISELLEYINNTYDGRNLSGVVIATDGIYNRGANPIYTPIRHTAPIHFVALGDTSVRRDLMIRRILHNRIAYLDEKFSIQIDIAGRMANGSSTTLNVFSMDPAGGRQQLYSEEFTIDSDDFFTTTEIVLEANRPGLNHFRAILDPIPNELSEENNVRDFYVEVLDTRQRVLILGSTPHPDLGSMKSLLENFQNYEVDLFSLSNWEGNFDDYDLVVLHQIPSRLPASRRVLEDVMATDRPLLFVLGNQSDINQFNRSQELLQISGGGNRFNDAVPLVNNNFNPFTFDQDLFRRLRGFVPLQAPFGQYQLAPFANTLLHQRIGQVETDMPMLTFGEVGNRRMGILAGEGIWKWRLYEFSSFDGADATADLLQKTVQYLSIREDDRRLRVYTDKNLFDESELVVFEAEYYNASFQRVNEPDVRLTISDAEDNQFAYNFDRRADHYILNTGPFNPGEYSYIAEVEVGMERFTVEGGFTVRPIQLESINLEANHGLLNQIARNQGGQLFYPENLQSLLEFLSEDHDFRPVVHSSLRTNLVLNLFWVCIAILGLLFVEWFMRRFYGSY
ncbi:MAG: hypothetical protein EA409_02505 [Saprospirales bacterium]|nr:MAG: hypothetical protein EA409_02505 [Saprospirales bacterium]